MFKHHKFLKETRIGNKTQRDRRIASPKPADGNGRHPYQNRNDRERESSWDSASITNADRIHVPEIDAWQTSKIRQSDGARVYQLNQWSTMYSLRPLLSVVDKKTWYPMQQANDHAAPISSDSPSLLGQLAKLFASQSPTAAARSTVLTAGSSSRRAERAATTAAAAPRKPPPHCAELVNRPA